MKQDRVVVTCDKCGKKQTVEHLYDSTYSVLALGHWHINSSEESKRKYHYDLCPECSEQAALMVKNFNIGG